MTEYHLTTQSEFTGLWAVIGGIRVPCPLWNMRADGRNYAPWNLRVMCHSCGSVWASRHIDNAPKRKQNWSFRYLLCEQCGGGSLWVAGDPAWNKSIVGPLLHREMRLVQNWYEEGIRTSAAYFNKIIWRV